LLRNRGEAKTLGRIVTREKGEEPMTLQHGFSAYNGVWLTLVQKSAVASALHVGRSGTKRIGSSGPSGSWANWAGFKWK
jgi:hypothetical protein